MAFEKNNYSVPVDTSRIVLGNRISVDLYSSVAEATAKAIHDEKKKKSAQIRRFYDELVMWHEKVRTVKPEARQEKYDECAPYIQMICAKVAYAKGREHVNGNFEKVINCLIRQIKDPLTLQQAKLFFEAVIGFRKALETNK